METRKKFWTVTTNVEGERVEPTDKIGARSQAQAVMTWKMRNIQYSSATTIEGAVFSRSVAFGSTWEFVKRVVFVRPCATTTGAPTVRKYEPKDGSGFVPKTFNCRGTDERFEAWKMGRLVFRGAAIVVRNQLTAMGYTLVEDATPEVGADKVAFYRETWKKIPATAPIADESPKGDDNDVRVLDCGDVDGDRFQVCQGDRVLGAFKTAKEAGAFVATLSMTQPVEDVIRRGEAVANESTGHVCKCDAVKGALEGELNDAEDKAFDAMARGEYQSFGHWAAIWGDLNRIGDFRKANPFADLCKCARDRQVGINGKGV